MKTFLLSLLGITLTSVVFAQDWAPFYPQDLSHYRYQDGDSTIRSVRIDSVRMIGTDSVYFLNQIVLPCDTCPGPGYLHPKAVVWGPTGFGRSFTIDSVGNTYVTMRDSSVVVFARDLTVGESWVLDTTRGIQASLISVEYDSIFGQADSIRTIDIGNDTILLSKNHGLIQFPDSLSYGRRLRLWGIENRELGQKDLGYREIYDFQVGDVFYYHKSFGGTIGYWSYAVNQEILVKERTDYQDSIVYEVVIRECNPFLTGPSDTCRRAWVFSKDNCLMEEALNEEIVGSKFLDLTGIVEYDGGYSQVISTPNYKSTALDTSFFTSRAPFFVESYNQNPLSFSRDGGVYEYLLVFERGLGITKIKCDHFESFSYETLVGYIKGQDTVGTIYPGASLFTSIEEEIPESVIQVFPNPVSESLNLTLSDPAILPVRCQIMDMRGKGIAEYNVEELNSQFQVHSYPEGLYLIQITDREGRVHREKILVQSSD